MVADFSLDSLGSWFALFFIFVFLVRAGFAIIENDYTKNKVGNKKKKFGYSPKTFFSVSGLLNFAVGFCLSWDFVGITSLEYILVDIIIGLFSMALIPYLLYLFTVYSCHGKFAFPDRLIYRIGTVEKITEKSIVIRFSTHDRYGTLNAFPAEGFTVDNYKEGDLVYISKISHTAAGYTKLMVTPYIKENFINNKSEV